jgi:hypothetical protein
MRYLFVGTVFVAVTAVVGCLTVHNASAARLYFRMAKNSYTTGESDFATLNLDTQNKTANAVSATITFDPALIEITGISTDKTIVSMWVQSGAIDNARGTLSFKAVIFNPAFKGELGRLIGFDFIAKAPGKFPFSVANVQVLANDGKGTSISTSPVPRSISISGSILKKPQVDPKKDTTPPVNTITVLPRQNESILPVIRAKASDAKSGVAYYEVWANGKKLTRATSLNNFKLSGLKTGKNTVEIKVFDKAGNVRTDKISVLYNPLKPKVTTPTTTPTKPQTTTPVKPKTVTPVKPKIKAPLLFD